MSYTSKLKKSLNKCIKNLEKNSNDFCIDPGKNFTRKRKSDFSSIIKAVLCFGGRSLNKELLECFGFSPETLSPSAFVQQRSKIKSDAFYQLFRDFTQDNHKNLFFHGYRLLAVDGSDIYTPNEDVEDNVLFTDDTVDPQYLHEKSELYERLYEAYNSLEYTEKIMLSQYFGFCPECFSTVYADNTDSDE